MTKLLIKEKQIHIILTLHYSSHIEAALTLLLLHPVSLFDTAFKPPSRSLHDTSFFDAAMKSCFVIQITIYCKFQ